MIKEKAKYRSAAATLAIASLAVASALATATPSRATILTYDAVLSGAGVSVPVVTTGSGFALVTIDTVANTLQLNANFADLIGTDTAAHIHCCTALADVGTAGVATPLPSFPGFPSGVTSGAYDHVFDLTMATSYNPAFVTANGDVAGAEAALLAGIATGHAYFTLHTTTFPSGEIAGFLTPAPVPEPTTWALLIAGFGLAGGSLRRTRSLAKA
jgi:hypothetical protein